MSKAMIENLMRDNEAFMSAVGPSPELQAASEPQVASEVPQQDEGLRGSQSNGSGNVVSNSSRNGKRKPRGLNQLQWGKNGKETLHMNGVGQPIVHGIMLQDSAGIWASWHVTQETFQLTQRIGVN